MQLAGVERPPQHLARAEQVLLAHDLGERGRAHPVGERRGGGGGALRFEQIH